jgi:hypothetical protein
VSKRAGDQTSTASFLAIRATWVPWNRAPANSFSLGIRSPFPPAIVDAP